MDIEWRPIPNRNGVASSRGDIGRIIDGELCLLPKTVDVHGYDRVKGSHVHRLVASAFIGPRPARHDVNHLDGNKTNNCPDNLCYVSRSENMKHAYRTGLRKLKLGSIDEHSVLEIRSRHAAGVKGSVLARTFGVSQMAISYVVRGIYRKAVTA